jgi:hypothetical protein
MEHSPKGHPRYMFVDIQPKSFRSQVKSRTLSMAGMMFSISMALIVGVGVGPGTGALRRVSCSVAIGAVYAANPAKTAGWGGIMAKEDRRMLATLVRLLCDFCNCCKISSAASGVQTPGQPGHERVKGMLKSCECVGMLEMRGEGRQFCKTRGALP